jgi:hypothetical protein
MSVVLYWVDAGVLSADYTGIFDHNEAEVAYQRHLSDPSQPTATYIITDLSQMMIKQHLEDVGIATHTAAFAHTIQAYVLRPEVRYMLVILPEMSMLHQRMIHLYKQLGIDAKIRFVDTRSEALEFIEADRRGDHQSVT